MNKVFFEKLREWIRTEIRVAFADQLDGGMDEDSLRPRYILEVEAEELFLGLQSFIEDCGMWEPEI